ncbi:carbohydrate ABC transporter permease [Bacillus sp. 3255]|uniref:carbohydrate ABC transporter permease n=1 Tax=Bacillus sp. 3255 TaxID=2817904 RepID=UPI002859ADF7|nr:carbohydrate ABC transporter permease [Bacillus sp. 3255]MDR6882421.1 ABC-type glycerol-3-phosphate transport system permease component [Bacillus sp. 3255]
MHSNVSLQHRSYSARIFLGNIGKRLVLWGFLAVMVVLTLFPVIMAFLGSFKTNAELTLGASLFPTSWEFENYYITWKKANFSTYMWNSIFLSTASTIGILIVASMAAYAVDRREFLGKRLFLLLHSIMMFISLGVIVLRPQFDIMMKLGLHKSLLAVIILLIAGHGFIFFILLGFVKGIHREVDEAAMLDGASFAYIYARIVLPLMAPGLGVSALFAFRGAWNEYILPLVFTMTQPKLMPLTVGLTSLRYGYGGAVQNHLMLTGAVLSMFPILILYVIANKSFMQMSAGSLKG